jgi:DNA-binding NtrC family response regulator
MAYDWARNNVRELRNIIERMIIATDREVLEAGDVPEEIRSADGAPELATPDGAPRTFQDLKAEAERQIVVAALERNQWHITRTAKELGLADHASLLKIMRRHGLSRA